MHNADDSVTVRLLVYTKSASFDYQWVYGIEDKTIQHELQNHLLNWISANQLAALPTVTAFFRLRNYFALMVAQESKTRVDLEQRPIFQRALFLWEQSDGLCYHHLEPLSLLLREEAEVVYSQLPNDTVRLEPQARQIRLKTADLDKETAHMSDDYWELPGGLTWQDVIREQLVVEVPGAWDFRKMVAGLMEHPISPSDMVYIGNSLTFESRNPTDASWLVSAKGLSPSSEPTILTRDGQAIPPSELSKHRQKTKAGARTVSSQAAVRPDPESGLAPLREEKIVREPQGERSGTLPRKRAVEGEMIEHLFGQYADPDLYFHKTNRSELMRFLKKVLARDRSPLVEAETRVLMLLTPATLKGYQDGNYSDVVVSWNNLLNEILVFYHQTSKGMSDEWGRRLTQLYKITVHNLAEPPKGWVEQFTEACRALQKILNNL